MSATTDGMEEIVNEFLAESAEGLDRLEGDLVELEHDPTSSRLLAEIFRAVHTIKGSSGMLGYSKLESVAHAGEGLLGALREGRLVLNPALASGLLAMVDALRTLLRAIERTGSEGPEDYGGVARALEELLHNSAAGVVAAGAVHNAAADLSGGENHASGGRIRVDVVLLDHMMDLLGELVLARNQILRLASSQTGSAALNAAQRLKRVTADMQDAVIKTRLQPIGSVWNKFPRLARDLALACGKQVIVEMEGSGTELDRTLLEAIRDPLTHILRNAIAHGIEPPEQRTRAGKSAAGRLRFRACHLEGRIHLEVADDGAGLNLERVRRRAIELGLLTPEQAAEAGEKQLARLVFAPGFSTAETVTKVSGRGVGLDVVKTNIEKIGGTVDLQSVTGAGTTLYMTLPLTLAILPALIISSGGQRFAIPQANLVEVARLEDGPASSIEQVCGAPAFRMRDGLLPLFFLDRELGLEAHAANDLHIVVLQSGAGQFGVVVDALYDSEEIVVKPLGPQLRALACFAGAAILGDGRVVLVIDVGGLAQMAGVVAGPRVTPASDADRVRETNDEPASSWLVFRGTTGSRYALPLSAVARLEEIPAERIERSAGREIVQYCGQIMPLLRVSRLFQEPEQERGLLQVAVLHESGLRTGLVMDRIEDIVEAVVELQPDRHSELLQGSAVIQGRVADVLDLKNVLARGEGRSVQGATEGGR